MYIPKYTSSSDSELIRSFIFEHSFGTLVSSSGQDANHYPFLLNEENGKMVLWTHLARSNPQWQSLKSQKCLVIFTGPHSYISPTFYVDNLNVPTWNYTAIHARCKADVISDPDLEKRLMKQMVEFYEKKNQTNWVYYLPENFHKKLLNAIVWIKLEVENIEAKFKLSQNRERSDYESVIKHLSKRESENDKELLKLMNLTNPFR